MNRERMIIEGRLSALRRERTETIGEARTHISGIRERLSMVLGRELEELDMEGVMAQTKRLGELYARLREIRAEARALEAELS